MADTLKPCPFCGGAAKPIPPTPRAYAFVECVGCRVATSGFATTKGAEDAWNDRAVAIRDLLAALDAANARAEAAEKRVSDALHVLRKAAIAIETWHPSPDEPLNEINALLKGPAHD